MTLESKILDVVQAIGQDIKDIGLNKVGTSGDQVISGEKSFTAPIKAVGFTSEPATWAKTLITAPDSTEVASHTAGSGTVLISGPGAEPIIDTVTNSTAFKGSVVVTGGKRLASGATYSNGSLVRIEGGTGTTDGTNYGSGGAAVLIGGKIPVPYSDGATYNGGSITAGQSIVSSGTPVAGTSSLSGGVVYIVGNNASYRYGATIQAKGATSEIPGQVSLFGGSYGYEPTVSSGGTLLATGGSATSGGFVTIYGGSFNNNGASGAYIYLFGGNNTDGGSAIMSAGSIGAYGAGASVSVGSTNELNGGSVVINAANSSSPTSTPGNVYINVADFSSTERSGQIVFRTSKPLLVQGNGGGPDTTLLTSADLEGLDADLLDGQHGSYYQQALVSGTNIKTINGVSVLGPGNIEISSGGGLEQSFLLMGA